MERCSPCPGSSRLVQAGALQGEYWCVEKKSFMKCEQTLQPWYVTVV